MGNYRELKAWQDAMDLLDSVYVSVRSFPRSEMFSLTDQLKRSALSIPLNLAEGCGRFTHADQRHFYVQARGSINEVETLVEVAKRQKFLTEGEAAPILMQANKVARRINALVESLKPDRR